MIPSSSYRCVYLALLIFCCLFGCTYPASWSSPSIASNAVSVVAGSWTSTTDVLIIGTQVPTATFSNVMRSTNGGSTWSEVQKLTSGNPQFYDISSRIIGSTTYSVVVAAGGTIYVSQNLFTSYSSGKLTGSSIQFYSVTIAPSGFAFAVGSASSRPAVYMSNSSTGFINWSPLSSSVFTASTKKLRGVATFDGQNILAVGTSLTVFQSANNGSTWSTVDLSSLCTTSSTDLYSVAYKNKNFAMIGGTNGCIVKYDKTSGSYAWNLVSSSYITSSSAFFYHSISIASNNIVFLIENVQGQILRSVDSGVTWYREQQSNNVKLYCVAAYDYNLALVGTDNTVNTAFVYLRAVDPSSQPTNQPSGQPSCRPTSQPSLQPVSRPSAIPSRQPSSQPSQQPIMYPSARPSLQPSSRPSGQPTAVPLLNPSAQPSGVPSRQPSVQPTAQPTQQPMMHPSAKPSCQPSGQPSRQPVGVPSSQPSLAPSAQPSSQPSRQPTTQPSGCPTTQPSSRPSHMPSAQPSAKPSRQPTSQPSGVPTAQPSSKPSRMPSSQPSASPTVQPTVQPSRLPTGQPSSHPTHQPTVQPSALPTHQPTSHPSMQPTGNPSTQPTNVPSSSRPTSQPTGYLLEGNWTSIAGIFDDSAYRFLDVRCSDTINCVMVGYYFDVVLDTNVGIIAHTAHGGVSKYVWSVVKRLPGYKVKAVTYYEPYSHWFALDHLGGVYGSTDSGETWISYWNFTLAEVNVTAAAVHNNLTSTVDVLNGIACNYGGGLYLTGPNIMWYGYIAGITGPDYSIDWKYTKGYKNINDVTETDTDVVAVAADEGKIGTCYYNRERGLECSLTIAFTTSPFYSVGATKNQLVGIATDGTVVKRDERNDWSRLPLNISEWTDSRDYGHNVVCLTNAVYYIADSGGRIYETKNGGTIWVNETLIAVSPLPLYSLYFWSTSVAIAGNGRGGTFIKRPKPSAAPTSHPSGMPTMQPSRQPICRPTGQPSRSPTSQPSSQPSRRPTTQPTRQPINRPTGQPSRRPTSQPSKSPTSQPSGVPSSQPQGRPSAQPSFQPSGLPTVQPSGRPSGQPSLVPSGQPSGVPSAQPSSQPSGMPSGQPSGFPTKQPTGVPSVQPTSRPSGQPSRVPTCQPSMRPSRQPSAQPSAQPIGRPSGQPSRQPTAQPSRQPSGQPSGQPSRVPTNQPSASPTRQPTGQPSRQPTRQPSGQPSRRPTSQPSRRPTNQPSASPTRQPTGQPSRQPSGKPSGQPTMQPSVQPTSIPSAQPSGWPSAQPTCMPSGQPSGQPTVEPTGQPSVQPTRLPSSQPSSQPSGIPSGQPSGFPSMQPTSRPSAQPSRVPTNQPTRQPSGQPTSQPSMQPLNRPTTQPSCQPSGMPSVQPSGQPSNDPSTQPSGQPTRQPSGRPTAQPSRRPTTQPSVSPSRQPTCQPTRQPVMRPSAQPTRVPTSQPSRNPTRQPTAQPSRQPTSQPTRNPTRQPTAQPSRQPFSRPTGQPSRQPSSQPSRQPTNRPTGQPSKSPSTQPSSQPSEQPSGIPSSQPSGHPSALPTCQPSTQPTGLPTGQPSGLPSGQPTVIPSGQPSVQPSCQPSSQPVGFPTMQPSVQPSGKPSMQPSGCPSMQPSSQPSAQPTLEPTSQPSCQPTFQPSSQPSRLPSVQPSGRPSSQPSAQPTMCPSGQPSNYPSALPTMQPTGIPSRQPVGMPSSQPTRQPSARPSRQPTRQPTGQPSRSPTMQPSRQPSRRPTSQPTRQPSRQPTGQPTRQPTSQPSASPTRQPTSQPSKSPTNQPTGQPSRSPSIQPSASPTSQPSRQPSKTPSTQPSASPTCQPSMQPTMQPTSRPSMQPSRQPTSQPTGQPSRLPTSQPSKQPYSRPTGQPSRVPTSQPSGQPSRIPTRQPTRVPTTQPTRQPVSRPTMQPTRQPWSRPTSQPSRHPTSQPSRQPSSRPSHQPTSRPTGLPSQQPASLPTLIPSAQPSMQPSGMPSGQPSHFPSAQPSQQPTDMPSGMPSAIPTRIPTGRPTAIPTQRPLCHPTSQPTKIPTSQPSRQPSRQPSSRPTRRPSGQPSRQPTNHPSHVPTAQPSSQPSAQPSDHPSAIPTGQPSKAPSVQPSSAPSVQPSGSPSTQPTKSPSSQPTSIPTTSFPTCQPSSQPSALPTTQPSVSPTKALLFAFSFNVTQAIQGSTEARYTRDKVNAVKAIVTTVTDIVPSTVYPDVRIIKVTDILIGSRRLSGFEAEESKDLLSGTKGILVVYGLTYIPTSKDKNDKIAEYQRTKLILTEAVQSGLFNSTLRENAILFNATSLFKANAVEEFFNVSSFIDSSFLHSPRPTSQPTSSPSQQPFSVPSSLPSSQPAGFPTSQPSVRPSTIPTSQPTFSLATKYTILLERLVEKYTLPQIYLKNVFYEGIARNDQIFDTCGMWTAFLDNNLEFSSLESSKLIKTVQLLQESLLDPSSKPQIKRCEVPRAATDIVNAVANRNLHPSDYPEKEVVSCDGDSWVVHTCGSTGSVALCVNCDDPCVDPYCAIPENVSTINPYENANFSTGYITISPCVDENYDYSLCPVQDGLVRIFSVEMAPQSAGVLPVFFAYFTAGLILVFTAMYYERRVYSSSKKKVQDVRVFNTPSTRNVELDNLAEVYPSMKHSDSRGSGDFHGQNPSLEGPVHFKYAKTTMLTQLASIFRFTYFDPKINQSTIDDGPQEMAASNRQLREKLWLGVFPFHYFAMAYHSVLSGSRSLRIKYHILSVHRMILMVFFMSVFFNAQFVADDGTCNRQTSKSDCESFRTTFSTSVQTCLWKTGDFTVTSDTDSELFVPLCVWQDYQPTSDIYFRLVLVSLLIVAITRPIFHNKAIEQILFHNSKTIYFSNVLLSILQLGINRHRWLYMRSQFRALLRFCRKCIYRMYHCMDKKQAEVEMSPSEEVIVATSSRRNSSSSNRDASVRPETPVTPSAGRAAAAPPTTPRLAVDHNTVSESVAIQISSDSSVLLNDFKQSLFSYRATFKSGDEQCHNFDLRWGIHPEDGTLFSLSGDKGCTHRLRQRLHDDHCDPEILLAEEMMTVQQEGNQVDQELVLWAANRQAYLDQKRKRKNTVVESFEDSIGKGLFLVFILDLIGRDTYIGMSFQRILYDTVFFQSQPQTTTLLTKAYLAGLLVIDALFVFYSVQYTRQKPFALQYVWFILAVLCLAIDAFVIEGLELLWCKVIVPFVINTEVLTAIQVLVGLINNYNGAELAPSSSTHQPPTVSRKSSSAAAAAAAATKEENEEKEDKEGEEEEKKDIPEGTSAIVVDQPATTDSPAKGTNGEESADPIDASAARPVSAAAPAAPLASAPLTRGISTKQSRKRNRAASLSSSSAAITLSQFTVSRYFGVACAVTPKYKSFPHSTIIEAYRECMPPAHLAAMCHYSHEAVIEAARHVEVEDSTAYVLVSWLYRSFRSSIRSSAYYFVLWTSAKVPTELQRMAVSCWTIFMVFVIYKLAKQVIHDVPTGLIAIFLIAAFIALIAAIMVDVMCPINFSALRSGVRVAQDWSANIFRPSEDKEVDPEANEGADDVFSSHSIRNEKELQAQHHEQVMEDTLNDVLGVGTMIGLPPLGGFSAKELQQIRQKPHKPEEYQLSESEYDSNDSDDDDDLSSHGNAQNELGDLNTDNRLLVLMASEREEAKMGESRGEVETSSSDEDDSDNDPEDRTAY